MFYADGLQECCCETVLFDDDFLASIISALLVHTQTPCLYQMISNYISHSDQSNIPQSSLNPISFSKGEFFHQESRRSIIIVRAQKLQMCSKLIIFKVNSYIFLQKKNNNNILYQYTQDCKGINSTGSVEDIHYNHLPAYSPKNVFIFLHRGDHQVTCNLDLFFNQKDS